MSVLYVWVVHIYKYIPIYMLKSLNCVLFIYHDNNDHNKCFFYHVIIVIMIMIIMLQHFKYYLYLISLKHAWYVLQFYLFLLVLLTDVCDLTW